MNHSNKSPNGISCLKDVYWISTMRVNATLRSDWEYITENAIFRSDREEVPETEGRSLKENRRYSGLRNDRAYLNVDWVEGSSFMKSVRFSWWWFYEDGKELAKEFMMHECFRYFAVLIL